METQYHQPENASRYFNDFVLWSRKNNVDYFYFEAFDEAWKADYEGPQSAHWGVWDGDGNMKPGMETVFIRVLPVFPGCTKPPLDPNNDSLYEDINGNGKLDFADVVRLFNMQ